MAALAAVGDIDVRPAIPIEIDDRHRRPHGCNLRHNVLELGIEGRSGVHEIDAGSLGGLLEAEAIAGQRRGWIGRHRSLAARFHAFVHQRERQLSRQKGDQ